jgi:hypothetical protein
MMVTRGYMQHFLYSINGSQLYIEGSRREGYGKGITIIRAESTSTTIKKMVFDL